MFSGNRYVYCLGNLSQGYYLHVFRIHFYTRVFSLLSIPRRRLQYLVVASVSIFFPGCGRSRTLTALVHSLDTDYLHMEAHTKKNVLFHNFTIRF